MRVIFIGGCDRSGTTILGSLLGEAEGVIVTPESQFKSDAYRLVLAGELKDYSELNSYIENHWRYRLWNVAGSALVEPEGKQHEATLAEYTSENIIARVKAYGLSGDRRPIAWVDHTPRNLHDIYLLKQLFPAAKFLHVVRDGRGVAASVLPLDWGPNTASQAARWWGARLTPGLAAESAWPTCVRRVSYEKLITEPEATLRDLCGFLGLDFSAAMFSGSGFSVPRFTSRQHALVGTGLDRSRIDAWRNSLSDREREIFEAEVGGILHALGYPLDFKGSARLRNFSERVSDKAREMLYTKGVNQLKYRLRRFSALR